MKLECPECKTTVTVKGNGWARCPRCKFAAKVPRPKPAPAPKPQTSAVAPAPAPAQQAPGQPTEPGEGTNGLAIAALVTGIIGLCGAFPIAIAALIMGIIGKNQCIERGQQGAEMATAGIVMGAIGLALSAFWMMPWFWF